MFPSPPDRRRQHRLEEEHAELEYEIRCLMMKADSLKSDMERQREQRLIERCGERGRGEREKEGD